MDYAAQMWIPRDDLISVQNNLFEKNKMSYRQNNSTFQLENRRNRGIIDNQ